MDTKILLVGKELMKETLPLEMGSCLYQLKGLQSNKWYEVKISYPASVCILPFLLSMLGFFLVIIVVHILVNE